MTARKTTASTMKLVGSMLRPTPIGHGAVRFASTKSGGKEKKSPARLAEVQRNLYQAEERYKAGGGVEPIPKITLDHVTISYAGSGGSGGQNVNKGLNLSYHRQEKNRINRDGEIINSSKKSRALKNKAEDAIAKLQVFTYQKKKLQAIIDACFIFTPPPSRETIQKIAELSAIAEQKQLDKKKAQS